MKKRESIAFWTALAILGAVAILAYRSTDAAVSTLAWVERTHVILRQLEDVTAAYSRAVTARRTYVVSGDESQLGDRATLDARLKDALAALRTSVTDDAEQLRRADALALLLNERIADLDSSSRIRRIEGTGAETSEGLLLAMRIRSVREEMATYENRLLSEKYERTRADFVRTKTAMVAGTLTSFVILLFTFGRLRQEIGLRRTAEASLTRSNRFLDSIVENIPDMIFVKEAEELRFERVNRAGEELLGIERANMLGRNDFDFFPPSQAAAFKASDRETLTRKVVVEISEEPIQTRRGPRWLHTKKVPIIDEKGRPRYLLGISEDVTERRKTAEALRVAKEAVEAANKELEAFSYSVAHDLRAPLRIIDGFSQALEEDCADKLDAKGLEHLARVRASATRMTQLIDGLLALSHVMRGEIVREPVDLSRIASQSAAELRQSDPDRRVTVTIADGLVCQGDARLLAAALDNLVGNAWKFTSKRPEARIEVGEMGLDRGRVFFVRDNGVGFDSTHAAKLFGVFQRLHSYREFEGTGIGLATVHRIIRRHGGTIWAEGAVGCGATFYFTL
jgi:PAS domain S-box-containing protein